MCVWGLKVVNGFFWLRGVVGFCREREGEIDNGGFFDIVFCGFDLECLF